MLTFYSSAGTSLFSRISFTLWQFREVARVPLFLPIFTMGLFRHTMVGSVNNSDFSLILTLSFFSSRFYWFFSRWKGRSWMAITDLMALHCSIGRFLCASSIRFKTEKKQIHIKYDSFSFESNFLGVKFDVRW